MKEDLPPTQRFKVGDKVVVRPEDSDGEMDRTIPKLVLGRVYCVERVNVIDNSQWIRLVGVRENRRKCLSDRGVFHLVFQLVGRQGTGADRTESA